MYFGAVELHYTAASPNASVTSYYLFSGQRVAMNKGGTLTYLHGDHLGSASIATDGGGNVIANSELAYKPFGGVLGGGTGLDTPYRFTNQRSDESATGLYDYNARFYSPVLGRFVSADSIVPGAGNPQSLNRYAYTRNNPLKFIDPTGHAEMQPDDNGAMVWTETHHWGGKNRLRYQYNNKVTRFMAKPTTEKQQADGNAAVAVTAAHVVLAFVYPIGIASYWSGYAGDAAGQIMERVRVSEGDIYWAISSYDGNAAKRSGAANVVTGGAFALVKGIQKAKSIDWIIEAAAANYIAGLSITFMQANTGADLAAGGYATMLNTASAITGESMSSVKSTGLDLLANLAGRFIGSVLTTDYEKLSTEYYMYKEYGVK